MHRTGLPRSRKYALLDPVVITAACLFGLGALAITLFVRSSLDELVESIALEQTAQYARTVDAFREVYTSEVVARIGDAGGRVSHDYAAHRGAIPLPVTFSMILGERIAETQSGGGLRVYSAYPFPWRKDEGGPRDDFERDALQRLSRDPDRPVHRFEEVGGVPSVRLANAYVLGAGCVSCHNSHPDTPKADWEEGDVRGVLAVTLPLNGARAQTEAATTRIWGAVTILLACSLLVFWLAGRRATHHAVALAARENELQRETLLRDQAESRNAEYMALMEQHQASERHLSAILETAAEGIITIDNRGIMESFNRAAAAMFGYEEREVIGQNVKMLMPAELAEHHDCHLQRYQRSRGGRIIVLRRELKGRRRDGSLFPVSIAISETPTADGRIRFAGIIRDLTEQRSLEAQLLQSQKLESIGQLAAGIAHEINTPAQYVGHNLEFLEQSFGELGNLLKGYRALQASANGGDVSPELLSEVNEATEAADIEFLEEEVPRALLQSREGIGRVTKIVRAMKEFSHPGSSEKEPVDLNRAIESTVVVAGNEWKYVAELETDFDRELPPVPCLAAELNQVVLNIVVNAAQALAEAQPEGVAEKGRIRIRTQREGDAWALLEISDTGPGMPEAVRSRVFDPFFTTKQVGKGTGQGLAIARSVVVDKHGGTIHVESEEGRGTTFRIRLPLRISDADTSIA